MSDMIDNQNISDIINHHKNIFGINKDLELKSYLHKTDAIFSLYNMFCLIDDNYIGNSNIEFSHDVLAIISFYNQIVFENSNDLNIKIKNELIKIIDTKLYYFDQFLCYGANNSIEIQNYLRTMHIYKLKSTNHFLETTKKEFKNIAHIEYLLENLNLKTTYKQSSIDFILSISNLNKEDQVIAPILKKVIKSKSKIALFRDMHDDDIKNLISIFNFSVYQAGETIIHEGDVNEDIYFILSGQCSVLINKSHVSKLEKNQIFGEFAFLLQQPRSATIKATQESTIMKFKFDEELFHKYAHSFSLLYKNITNELILKISTMNQRKNT